MKRLDAGRVLPCCFAAATIFTLGCSDDAIDWRAKGGSGGLAAGGASLAGAGVAGVSGSVAASLAGASSASSGAGGPLGGGAGAAGSAGSALGGASASGGSATAGAGGSAGAVGWQTPPGELPVESVRAAKSQMIAHLNGSDHNEGPSWHEGVLSWCDRGGVYQMKLPGDTAPFLLAPLNTCGATFSAADGTLLLALAADGVAQITKANQVVQLASVPPEGFANDLSVDAYGNVYSSNTSRGEIVRVSPMGTVGVVASNLPVANGVEVDPASKYLYVNLLLENRVVRLPITSPQGTLGDPENFVDESDLPDGITFDAWGNFWLAEAGQPKLRVFNPQGKELVQVDSGGASVTNLTFGGPDYDVLYVTGGGVLRRVDVRVPGFPGHPGATSYPSLKKLPYNVNAR